MLIFPWEWLRSHAVSLPLLAKFAVGIAVIVIIPKISRRIRLPSVVGLLLCGVLFGPYGLELIGKNRPIADFLAELGKLMLMFIAGLEINLGLLTGCLLIRHSEVGAEGVTIVMTPYSRSAAPYAIAERVSKRGRAFSVALQALGFASLSR